jgi:hypothetical protein
MMIALACHVKLKGKKWTTQPLHCDPFRYLRERYDFGVQLVFETLRKLDSLTHRSV